MALVKLTDYEKELCIEVVQLRLEFMQQHYGEDKISESILSALQRRIVKLTPTQKAFISGCINEEIMDNSEDIIKSTHFELLLKHEKNNYDENYLRYDTAANLRNRFMSDKRKENHHRIILPIHNKIEQVLNSDKVFYSMSDDKVYKIAVLNSITKQYWSLEASNEHAFDKINFSTYNKHYASSYMYSGTPQEVLQLVKKYEQKNGLKWGYIRLKQLLEKIVEYSAEFKPAA